MPKKNTPSAAPVIFEYLDFKKFFQDLYDYRKINEAGFTLKRFIARAGIKSQGLLKMVIDGKRRLTRDMIDAFALGFDIRGKDKLYLETLVCYNQSQDPREKEEQFLLLNDLRPRSRKFTHEKRLHRYLTNDHYVTIREMVELKDFREDYAWIGERCAPPVNSQQAREAVETLLELGLLTRNTQGKLTQAENFVRTADYDNQILEAYHFHQAVLNKAKFSLGYLEQEKRSFQSLTISLPQKLIPEIIDKYYELRDWIVARSNAAGKGDEVFQVNFQLFPATQKKADS